MRLNPQLRIPVICVLTVAQGLFASYLIAKANNGFMLLSATLCFLAPWIVAWLFFAEMGDMERRFRARLDLD